MRKRCPYLGFKESEGKAQEGQFIGVQSKESCDAGQRPEPGKQSLWGASQAGRASRGRDPRSTGETEWAHPGPGYYFR